VSSIERRIAKIERTSLGYEDHGLLTFYLYLAYSGAEAQGAGGYILGGEHTDRFVRGVLNSCGVSEWEKLPGRTIYAYADWGKCTVPKLVTHAVPGVFLVPVIGP
jgi:hypothetical protein